MSSIASWKAALSLTWLLTGIRSLPLPLATSWRRTAKLPAPTLQWILPALSSSRLSLNKSDYVSTVFAITCTCEPNQPTDNFRSFVRLASIFEAVSPASQPSKDDSNPRKETCSYLLLPSFALHIALH